MYDEDEGVINFTEKRLFELFSSIEARGKKPAEGDYYDVVNKNLPHSCTIPRGSSATLSSAIRKYKRKKSLKESLATIVKSASIEVVLSVNIPPEDVSPPVLPVVFHPSDNTQQAEASSSSHLDIKTAAPILPVVFNPIDNTQQADASSFSPLDIETVVPILPVVFNPIDNTQQADASSSSQLDIETADIPQQLVQHTEHSSSNQPDFEIADIALQDDSSSSPPDIITNAVQQDEKPPAKKRSRGSTEFTTTFSGSYKDFHDLGRKQQENKTKPLLDMLSQFIETNKFTLTLVELLDYLKDRVKEKKDVAAVSFTPLEAISLMHRMVLSKEQMRQMRNFLKQKGMEFPTTNKILPVRDLLPRLSWMVKVEASTSKNL